MDEVRIGPQPGPQERFLASNADIAIFGGAAGGGKTRALLLEPLRHLKNESFASVVFRRSYPQITNPGGMWDESAAIYPLAGGKPIRDPLGWTFQSGMRVRFAHMQYDSDRFDWQGAQIALIEYDELTHFTEEQFFYMLSRNRSTCGVKPYIRGSCNPDPESFVARLIDWFIGDDGYPILERAGVLRWFVRIGDTLEWADTREALIERLSGQIDAEFLQPKSLTFVPAKVDDNPALLKVNPGYKANLLALPYIDRMRLLNGNWRIRAEAGKLFNRGWVDVVDAAPAGGIACRFWDFAATEKKMAKQDPDYTAAPLIKMVGGRYFLMDVIAFQEGPVEEERRFVNISRQDAALMASTGTRYMARWEIEPGSASKRDTRRLTAMLAGLDALGIYSRGDKITRAKPFLAQAEAGNVSLVRGKWNEGWLAHMHNQPDAPHDDIWDGTSGAFNALTNMPREAKSYQG